MPVPAMPTRWTGRCKGEREEETECARVYRNARPRTSARARGTHLRLRPLPESDPVQPDQAAAMLVFERNTEPGRNAEALPFASRQPAAPAARFLVCFGGAPPRTPPRRRSRAPQNDPVLPANSAILSKTRSRTGSWRSRENQNQPCPRPANDPTLTQSGLLGLCVDASTPSGRLAPTSGRLCLAVALRLRLGLCARHWQSPPPCLQTPAPVRRMGEAGRKRRCARAKKSLASRARICYSVPDRPPPAGRGVAPRRPVPQAAKGPP